MLILVSQITNPAIEHFATDFRQISISRTYSSLFATHISVTKRLEWFFSFRPIIVDCLALLPVPSLAQATLLRIIDNSISAETKIHYTAYSDSSTSTSSLHGARWT